MIRSAWRWLKITLVVDAGVYATIGIILAAVATNDPDACVNLKNASILGTVTTWLGILFAALASFEERIGG
jgi:hypothetical protein